MHEFAGSDKSLQTGGMPEGLVINLWACGLAAASKSMRQPEGRCHVLCCTPGAAGAHRRIQDSLGGGGLPCRTRTVRGPCTAVKHLEAIAGCIGAASLARCLGPTSCLRRRAM